MYARDLIVLLEVGAGAAVPAGIVRPGEVYQLQTWKARPSCSPALTPRFWASAIGLPQAGPGTLPCVLLSDLCQTVCVYAAVRACSGVMHPVADRHNTL